MADAAEQILKGSEIAGKSYKFDNSHDPAVPAQMWFQQSEEGEILFIVFYSMACRWSRCLGCNLPSKMSSMHVPFQDLMAQVDHVFSSPEVLARRMAFRKVIVSNNGSVLDEKTFSSTALMYLLAKLNLHLPNLAILSIETRPEYVDLPELEFLRRALAEGATPTELEIAIGFEAFDDRIRNEVFNKGLTLDVFRRLVGDIAPFGYRLKCYFMQKPVPGMTDEEAMADICRAIDFLDGIARESGIHINMHLNPTYAASGTRLGDAFTRKEYAPPHLRDVAAAVLHAKGKRLTIYVGLSDEGLAVPGGSFIRPGDEPLIAALEQFNRTQDHDVLAAWR
ncbi:MAG: hypothetical protein C0404_00395 [Verrucomicrobia bacterium]|nr:hypothetical protein [Verrucomicrobiota bacterium]